MRIAERFRRSVMGIDAREVTFQRRGFQDTLLGLQRRLELVGTKFLEGYHAALGDSDPAALMEELSRVEGEYRGFAFEGAGMALALIDAVSPVRAGRWERFVTSSGSEHRYMLHVGYGWAVARLPWLRWNLLSHMERFDPLLRWLIVDGYGFHEGYFYWPRQLATPAPATKLCGYARNAFDQGLGRSFWFIGGADVARIGHLVQKCDQNRWADLWSGIGLASAYAGAVSDNELARLVEVAGECRCQLAQGAAFAAKARHLAGNMAPHTERACQVLCNMTAAEAAEVTDIALHELPPDQPGRPAYEEWRSRIQSQFAKTREQLPCLN
jgi:hypothetical protein